MHPFETDYGPELPGLECGHCGGTLIAHGDRIYCDWCDAYVIPVIPGEPGYWMED